MSRRLTDTPHKHLREFSRKIGLAPCEENNNKQEQLVNEYKVQTCINSSLNDLSRFSKQLHERLMLWVSQLQKVHVRVNADGYPHLPPHFTRCNIRISAQPHFTGNHRLSWNVRQAQGYYGSLRSDRSIRVGSSDLVWPWKMERSYRLTLNDQMWQLYVRMGVFLWPKPKGAWPQRFEKFWHLTHARAQYNWAFTRHDRRTDRSVRLVCPTGRMKRLHVPIVGPTSRPDPGYARLVGQTSRTDRSDRL